MLAHNDNLLLAERVVLGSLMNDCVATSDAIGNLSSEAFCDPVHRALFWHLVVDCVEPEADRDLIAALNDVGGPRYLAEVAASGCSGKVPDTLIADACSLIRRNWIERCHLDMEDSSSAQATAESNVVDLASWATRGAA